MSTKIKDWDKWWQLAKIKIKISGNKMNTLFYIESYHPIQPGSIDNTNILPNDNAIYWAHLCASSFLFMYLSPSLSLFLCPRILTIPILPFTFRCFCWWILRWSQGHRRSYTLCEVSSIFNPFSLSVWLLRKLKRK